MNYEIIDSNGVIESSKYKEEILEVWRAIEIGDYQSAHDIKIEGQIKLVAVLDCL